jgi:CheY-like chemotaxis protein
MTLANFPSSSADQVVSAAPDWRPRRELDLVAQQVRAIERFNRACHMREEAAAAAARSREMRMDAARSLEVLRREHEALVSRAHEQLQASGHLLRTVATRRVVLAHRNDWFFRQVTQALEDSGVHVLAGTDNGADAVGLVVAEQPDLVLVEDTLSMLPGVEVVREIRRFSPETVVTAQAAYGDRVGQLLDAGASAVFTRRIPPADVARSLLRLVGAA